ncbi:TetR/AcrR family transcriptional regulator [Clostridium aestuarii]|uniref:TetR/AcrR family transcriptional regulator n=1 Tax=Clostridium aestuarii TaxID=338193 RepID=A0ABT4CZW2_9CLOT|nr:TetR/AcrR family transcriptional regulator [Clostridium aestuarii]MCY6484526.1 TetR/AcrR family transcriptional regulator [Clostridium aestuarii]
MPKQTFFNLSEERQKEITDISLKEFSSNTFEIASMNSIINEVGVAKGSFYRYFETKKDLYLFLLEYALNKKLEYLKQYTDTSSEDFFEIYKNIIFGYMKFDLLFPVISCFLKKAVQNGSIEEIQFGKSKSGKIFANKLIEKAQKEGKIKKNLDPDFILFSIIGISDAMISYINYKYGVKYNEMIKKLEHTPNPYEKELKLVFNQLVDVLKTGLIGS